MTALEKQSSAILRMGRGGFRNINEYAENGVVL